MTQEQYIQTLKNQLLQLNKEIDQKILSGQSYSFESKKHKELLAQIRKHTHVSIFQKLFPSFNF